MYHRDELAETKSRIPSKSVWKKINGERTWAIVAQWACMDDEYEMLQN